MSTRNELSGKFSDNWRRGGGSHSMVGGSIVGDVDAIVGAIAFMSDVQRAQVQLTALGYQPGTADGKLGPMTAAAMKKFQMYEGLTQTSTLDDVTKKRLDERTAGMALKLPNGTALAPSVVLTPTTNLPTKTADPTDLWAVVVEAQKNAGVPTIPSGGTTTPAIPTIPTTSAPPVVPPQPAAPSAPAEKKIFGLSMKTVTIGGVGALCLAGVGIALSMRQKNDEAATLRMGPPSVARTSSPLTRISGS